MSEPEASRIQEHPRSEPAPPPDVIVSRLDNSAELTPLGRYGWISGVAGAAVVIAMGYFASRRGALDHGWNLFGSSGSADRPLASAFVLLVCAATMFAIELAVRFGVSGRRALSVAEDLRAGRHGAFLVQCLKVYGIDLGLLSGVFGLYRVLNEYGYARHNPYYQAWFAIMPYIWGTYALGGLPYVVLTRALQADPDADRKQAAFVVMKGLGLAASRLGLRSAEPPRFDRYDGIAVRGLFVKAFFVPLMTVFFLDQFTHLVSNWGYVLGNTRPVAVHDVWNVSHSVIFSVDVGLAWAGYTVSSRWIKNTLFSVEPSLLGWVVALLSYPPFQTNFNYFFTTPNDTSFISLNHPAMVRVLCACSIASFAVYTASTACFGLRFSNLTHRGIITTGPYAIVRHPAYAAKNFSWWCIMAPVAVHQWLSGQSSAVYELVGLVAMTGLYAARALTEERHLGRDPEYQRYAQRVRFRFIPGLI